MYNVFLCTESLNHTLCIICSTYRHSTVEYSRKRIWFHTKYKHTEPHKKTGHTTLLFFTLLYITWEMRWDGEKDAKEREKKTGNGFLFYFYFDERVFPKPNFYCYFPPIKMSVQGFGVLKDYKFLVQAFLFTIPYTVLCICKAGNSKRNEIQRQIPFFPFHYTACHEKYMRDRIP